MVGALVLVAALLATAGAAGAERKETKKDVEARRNQIKQLRFEQEQVQRRLDAFRSAESDTLAEIDALSNKLRDHKRAERRTARRQSDMRRQKREQDGEIRRLTALIAEHHDRAVGHLRRVYRLSKIGDSATLIALAQFKDFFKNSHYLRLVIRTDRAMVARYQSLHAELEEKQTEVEGTLKELAQLGRRLASERKELGKGGEALRASLTEVRGNQELYAKYLTELENERLGMERALVALEQASKREEEMKAVDDPASLRGRLPPPSPGTLVAPFGKQDPRYQLKKFQRGVVIRVEEAAAINAVAPGRVVHAGPFRGYQALVVLDHGHGLFTIYGHLENLRIKKGGWVRAGTTLGVATFQPVHSEYDLYFEIRMKGEPQDPLEWFTPGSLSTG